MTLRFSPALAAALTLFSLALSGCSSKNAVEASPPPASQGVQAQAAANEDELRDALGDLKKDLDELIDNAASKVRARAGSDAEGAKRADEVQKRSAAYLAKILAPERDATKALLDLWEACVQMRRYFALEEGAKLFGDQQDQVVAAASRALEKCRKLAKRFLGPKRFETTEAAIKEHVNKHPWKNLYEAGDSSVFTMATDGLNFALTPVMAVGKFGSGVAGTVTSAVDIPSAIVGLVRSIENMPEDIFDNLTGAVDKITRLAQVGRLIDGWERVGIASEKIGDTAKAWPDDVSRVIHNAVDEAVRAQPQAVELLQEGKGLAGEFVTISGNTRAMTGDVEKIVIQSQTLMGGVDQVVISTQGLVKEVDATLKTADPILANLTKPGPPKDPNAPPGRPFNILEYQATVEALTGTVKELRGSLEEIHAMMESPQLAAGLAQATQEIDELVNLIAWRAGQLLALFFALLLGYRFVATKFVRKAPADR